MPRINLSSDFYGMLYVVPEPQADPEPLDNMPSLIPVPTLILYLENNCHVFILLSANMLLLTNTNWSKLRGNQGTGVELVIGRNWSSVEEAIGTTRLELIGRYNSSR